MRLTFLIVIVLQCFISCEKTKISNLNVIFLEQNELNKKRIVEEKILLLLKEDMEHATFQSRTGIKMIGLLQFDIYPNGALDSLRKIVKPKYHERITSKIHSIKKYGIDYNFIFTNQSDEIIQKVIVNSIVDYKFSNKTISYKNNFTSNKILKPNDTVLLKSYYIFNYQPNFDTSYFTIHKPKNITMTIKTQASNNVGFLDTSKEVLEIK